MPSLTTDIGKIFCSWDEDKEEFLKIRLMDICPNEDNKELKYQFSFLDENNRVIDKPYFKSTEEDYYKNIRTSEDWTQLQSDGIITVTNIVSVENEVRQIKDVVTIFFPNNDVTGKPESNQPHVVARQGITNIFKSDDSVGLSVSLCSLPDGYTLADFLENTSVISSKMCHVYKTDTADDLALLLKNDDTDSILKDLYDHQYQMCKNTIKEFGKEFEEENKPLLTNLNGYNLTLESFLKNTGFMYDVDDILNIADVDFKIHQNEKLDMDDILLLSTLYGGIKIDKAKGIKFDYDIDPGLIQMKYLLVRDCEHVLWIVVYTTSPDEIDAKALYNLTEERTLQLQARLKNCVMTYRESLDK